MSGDRGPGAGGGRRPFWRLRVAALAGLAAAGLAAASGCAVGADEPAGADARFANLGPDAAFVGAATCATCHEDVSASYASHGMANSLYRLTAETRVEPLLETPIVDARTGFEYRVVEVDGALAQEERQLDAAGREVARLVRPMEVVVGSGSAARTYFARRGDGLVQLPLTWYTQGGGRWDFSPGYAESNPRFGRTMPDGCMSCHNAVPGRVEGVEDAFASIPEGIGCERCHGPGSLHVEARLADDGPAEGPDPTIVNPAWLALDLRLDVCSQCHLHATVEVLRGGETAYSYRPGRPLSAHEGLFAVPGVDEGGSGIAVVSHAERMQASPCYVGSLETEAPLECVTCHDPHRGFEARPAGARSASCRSCHPGVQDRVPAALRAEHAPAADCASCHMPRVEADDAPHASFTDHWVRVVRGPARTAPPAVGRTGVVAPLAEADRGGDEGALYEGVAAIAYGVRAADRRALAAGAEFVRVALGRLGEPHGDARFLLGVALLQAGRPGDAVGPLEEAAEGASPRDRPQRLETLARALVGAGREREAVSAFREAVGAQPRRPATRREYGRLLLAQGRLGRAEPELGTAVRLDPWDAEAHLLLGLVDAAAGRDAGEPWREAVRLEPDLAGVLGAGVRTGPSGAEPLWAAADVFGWPAPAPVGGAVTVYSTSGARVASGAWPGVARGLGTGVYLVAEAGRAVRRVAVVKPAAPGGA